jgi:hypothetical protein
MFSFTNIIKHCVTAITLSAASGKQNKARDEFSIGRNSLPPSIVIAGRATPVGE